MFNLILKIPKSLIILDLFYLMTCKSNPDKFCILNKESLSFFSQVLILF